MLIPDKRQALGKSGYGRKVTVAPIASWGGEEAILASVWREPRFRTRVFCVDDVPEIKTELGKDSSSVGRGRRDGRESSQVARPGNAAEEWEINSFWMLIQNLKVGLRKMREFVAQVLVAVQVWTTITPSVKTLAKGHVTVYSNAQVASRRPAAPRNVGSLADIHPEKKCSRAR